MKLDVYVDAGSHQNKFSVGVVFYIDGIEVFKVSELIDNKYNITNIQNAELYAIDKALSLCKEAAITEKDIIIHSDNEHALSAAKTGSNFKGCNKLIKGHIGTYKGQLTKHFKNRLHFLKIASSANHGKAHDIASDALKGDIYEDGHKHYLALSSEEIKKRSGFELSVNPAEKEAKTVDSSKDLIINTLNISKIFDDAEDSFFKLQEDLFNKKKKLMDLKIKLTKEKSELHSLSMYKKKYLKHLEELRKSVTDAEKDKVFMIKDVEENTELLEKQESMIKELDRKVLLKREELNKLSITEDIKLKVYQEEYERLVQEIEFLKSMHNLHCEVM